ncbi:hypothetical protein BJX64DRAFT_270186 [Aspergillus heterothallicus]
MEPRFIDGGQKISTSDKCPASCTYVHPCKATMEMSTAVEKVLAIYELTEQILLHLHDNLGLIRAQRVCRSWRDIITTSPALRAACWYPPQLPSRSKSCNEDKISNPASIPPFSDDYNSPEEQYWLLNPAFAKLGFEIGLDQFPDITFQEEGSFDLRQRIYDTPGSWTTMLATNPPSKMMIIECYGDYSDDEIMYVEHTHPPIPPITLPKPAYLNLAPLFMSCQVVPPRLAQPARPANGRSPRQPRRSAEQAGARNRPLGRRAPLHGRAPPLVAQRLGKECRLAGSARYAG